jgi:hypothetical protein
MKEFLKKVFAGMAKESKFHLTQLSKALETCVMKHTWVFPTETYIPNTYKIRLNTENYRELLPKLPEFRKQLADQVSQLVLRNGYKLIISSISVSFIEDKNLTSAFIIEPLPPILPQGPGPGKETKASIPFDRRSARPSRRQGRPTGPDAERNGERKREKNKNRESRNKGQEPKIRMSRESKPVIDSESRVRNQEVKASGSRESKPTTGLQVLSGEGMRGKRFNLVFHKTILGRSPLADIRFPEDMIDVSDRHAIIHYDKQDYFIEDANSTTGTYVNETLIKKVKLEPGAEIRIGKVIMRFILEP